MTNNNDYTTTTSTHFTSYPMTQSTAKNKANNNNAHDASNDFPEMPLLETFLPTPPVPTHNNRPITELEMHYQK